VFFFVKKEFSLSASRD